MPIFVFIALTTFAIYLVFTVPRSAWSRESFRSDFIFGFLVVLFPFLAIALSAWAIFQVHYPQIALVFFLSDVLPAKFFSTILLGIVFGICLGILLRSIASGSPYRGITNREKILAGSLLALLVLGIGGEQLLQDAGRRVSKLSFGGAEVAFFDPSQLRRGRAEGDLALASGLGDPTAGAPAISLELLRQFPDVINRDRTNIAAAVARKGGSHPSSDQFMLGMQEAERLAQNIIAPFGECLAEI